MRILLHYLMRIATARRRLLQDSRGTAVLEMAIMTPVLLIIGLGVLEFGNLMFKRHLIEGGVRDAARYLSGMPDCTVVAVRTAAANLESVVANHPKNAFAQSFLGALSDETDVAPHTLPQAP